MPQIEKQIQPSLKNCHYERPGFGREESVFRRKRQKADPSTPPPRPGGSARDDSMRERSQNRGPPRLRSGQAFDSRSQKRRPLAQDDNSVGSGQWGQWVVVSG